MRTLSDIMRAAAEKYPELAAAINNGFAAAAAGQHQVMMQCWRPAAQAIGMTSPRLPMDDHLRIIQMVVPGLPVDLRDRSVGERITYLRDQAGMTQQQLAEASGIPRASLATWEARDLTPKLPAALALAEALGVPPLWLA